MPVEGLVALQDLVGENVNAVADCLGRSRIRADFVKDRGGKRLHMDVTELLRDVPDYREFLTLEELRASSAALAAEFPAVASLEVVGRSSEGRPIELLTIGRGSKNALLLGVPHPNEPIGTLTLEFLSRLLCEREDLRRELDYTFLIVKVGDPDGLALNEGWFKGAFSPLKYALNYYRPPHQEQVEWGFPVQYKTLRFASPPPETRSVMRLMDRFRPTFFYSLHNAGFCGVYFYVSHRLPRLFREFHRLVAQQRLPLHRGEPEVPYLEEWDRGVYRIFGVQDTYDFLEQTLGRDPAPCIAAGTSSDDHLQTLAPEAFSLVCELPYYSDPALEDDGPAGVSRREALAEGIAAAERIFRLVEGHFRELEPSLPDDRLFRSVDDYVRKTPMRLAAQKRDIETERYARRATRAEAFDASVCRSFYPCLYLGELYRLAQGIGAEDRAREIRSQIEEVMAKIEAASNMRVLPLRPLVAVQAGSGLLAMAARSR